MNLLIMGQNYHLVHHLWPSIPWFQYQAAYRATKPLLDRKGSPQRLGIFETLHDCGNFFYDVLLGIRSHSRTRSKLRWVAHFVPGFQNRRRVIGCCTAPASARAESAVQDSRHSEKITFPLRGLVEQLFAHWRGFNPVFPGDVDHFHCSCCGRQALGRWLRAEPQNQECARAGA